MVVFSYPIAAAITKKCGAQKTSAYDTFYSFFENFFDNLQKRMFSFQGRRNARKKENLLN